jgi:hypothetical protein
MTTSNSVGLDPWVEEKAGESDEAQQARIQQRGETDLERWGDKLSAPGAENALKFLCDSAPHEGIVRIGAMMRALKDFSGKCFDDAGKGRLAKYHQPLRISAADGRTVFTSPIMIATAAVAFSQTGWYKRRFHDLRSAGNTEKLLTDWQYPAELVRTVALLVGLKNLVRTAIGDDKEVGVWIADHLSFDDDDIANCFADLLRDRFPSNPGVSVDPKAMVDILVLVTAAYEARQKDADCALLERFEEFGAKIKNALNPSEPGGSQRGTLVAVEFSKFIFPDFTNTRKPFLEAVARNYLEALQKQAPEEQVPVIAWFCLDRYWSTMHGKALSALPVFLASRFVPWWGRPKCFAGLLGPGRTQLYKLKLEGDDAFNVIFEKKQPPIWERIDEALSVFRSYGGGSSRIPTAFLARQMEIIGFCYPEEVFELRVRGDEQVEGLSAYTSLWLPKDCPTIEELEALLVSPSKETWLNPKLLVTRYAASMVENRGIGFGYPARHFEAVVTQSFGPVEAQVLEAKWRELIAWAAKKNAHAAWDKYIGKYRAMPPVAPSVVHPHVKVKAVPPPLVLGVDIGGTYTKVALYDYDATIGALSSAGPRPQYKFPTKKPDATPYSDAADFVQRLDNVLLGKEKPDAKGEFTGEPPWPNWATDRKRIVAIGVTWPGAVAGGPGSEYVAANSKPLTYFQPFSAKKHWDAEAVEIRGLRLLEAFETHFEQDGRCPYVRLIKDAVAHILFERWQLEGFAPRSGEIVVGLTAGTGSGMAVLEVARDASGRLAGRAFDILAEVGRFITHISDPFPKDPSKDEPVGLGRAVFDSETLGKVAIERLTRDLANRPSRPSVAFPKMLPSLLIGWLIEESYEEPTKFTDIKDKFEKTWKSENPDTSGTLQTLRNELHAFLASLANRDWPDELTFAKEVALRAGWELADLIAATASIFGATSVITGGGPLTDHVGVDLRASSRAALEADYKYEVPASAIKPGEKEHRLARLIRLPEPYDLINSSSRPQGSSGPYGAAVAAIELLPK